MIKFIYFDFGAVLVNYDDVFQKVTKDFDIKMTDFMEFYQTFVKDMDIGKCDVNIFWNECVRKFNLKNVNDYDLAKSWVSNYKIIRPIHNLIFSLIGKVGIGIISNIPAEIWWAAKEAKWVPDIKYDEIILSSDVGVVKPDRKIYEMAQEKLTGINPNEILFVDDKLENLIEPNLMGWKTVCFDQWNLENGVSQINKLLS